MKSPLFMVLTFLIPPVSFAGGSEVGNKSENSSGQIPGLNLDETRHESVPRGEVPSGAGEGEAAASAEKPLPSGFSSSAGHSGGQKEYEELPALKAQADEWQKALKDLYRFSDMNSPPAKFIRNAIAFVGSFSSSVTHQNYREFITQKSNLFYDALKSLKLYLEVISAERGEAPTLNQNKTWKYVQSGKSLVLLRFLRWFVLPSISLIKKEIEEEITFYRKQEENLIFQKNELNKRAGEHLMAMNDSKKLVRDKDSSDMSSSYDLIDTFLFHVEKIEEIMRRRNDFIESLAETVKKKEASLKIEEGLAEVEGMTLEVAAF